MLLDLEIRIRTKNAKSLDDVMRYLLETYADKGIGFPEDGFLKAVETVAGSDFKDFFDLNVQSRKELDYNRLPEASWPADFDRKGSRDDLCRGRIREDRRGLARVKRIVPGSPAEKAKLDEGDVFVAMNNVKLVYDDFRSRLHSHKIGETLKLTILRGERLMTVDLTPIEYVVDTWTVAESPSPSPAEMKLRNLWLGLKEK